MRSGCIEGIIAALGKSKRHGLIKPFQISTHFDNHDRKSTMFVQSDFQQLSQLFDEKLAPIHQELREHRNILMEHSATLKDHGEILKEHSGILRHQDEILQSHSEILQSNSEILSDHGEAIKSLEHIVRNQEKTLKEHTKLLKSLKKDQILILDTLDREQIRQRRRLDRIEDYLKLPPMTFDARL